MTNILVANYYVHSKQCREWIHSTIVYKACHNKVPQCRVLTALKWFFSPRLVSLNSKFKSIVEAFMLS